MTKALLALFAIAGGAYLLTRKARAETSAPGVLQKRVTGSRSGIEWLQRYPEEDADIYILWAPENAFGPHLEMPVVRVNFRTNVAEAWPGAPEVAYQTAEKDFGLNIQR